MRLTHIQALPVLTEHQSTPVGTVQDALLDLDRRSVAYWQVRLRGVRRPILVAASRMRLAERSATVLLPVDRLVSEEAEDTVPSSCIDQDDALPDILTTPMGETAPANGIGAIWSVLSRARRQTPPLKPRSAPDSWVWGAEMTGKPFFSIEGELGRISDIEIDPANHNLSEVQVAQKGGGTLHILMNAMRHVPEGNSHFVARSAYRGGSSAERASQI